MSVDYKTCCIFGYKLSYDEFCEVSLTYNDGDNWWEWKEQISYYGDWVQEESAWCELDSQDIFVGIPVKNGASLEMIKEGFLEWINVMKNENELDFKNEIFKNKMCGLHYLTYEY